MKKNLKTKAKALVKKEVELTTVKVKNAKTLSLKISPPKKPSVKSSFFFFLADFKASNSK